MIFITRIIDDLSIIYMIAIDPEAGVATANLMDPNAWQIGPIIDGPNLSQGVPLRPSAHPEGWSIDIPYPNAEAGHVHYVTVPTGPLIGKAKVTLKARFKMAYGAKLSPVKSPDSPSLLTLYFQRKGDD
jgi:hypothetical protein